MAQHKKLPLVPERGTRLTREKLNEHFHSNVHFERNWTDGFAEFLTGKFGSVAFLILNACFFAVWLTMNSGFLAVKPFDPYPFNFLTMTVSLEAIFLSIIVLVSQNRQSKIADVRQQMDFEIDVRAEEEITKMLHMLDDLRRAAGFTKPDPELELMKKNLDLQIIKREAEELNGNA